jgi:hypothetical protein
VEDVCRELEDELHEVQRTWHTPSYR